EAHTLEAQGTRERGGGPRTRKVADLRLLLEDVEDAFAGGRRLREPSGVLREIARRSESALEVAQEHDEVSGRERVLEDEPCPEPPEEDERARGERQDGRDGDIVDDADVAHDA